MRISAIMKLGTVIFFLKKIKKIYYLCETHLNFCWHQHFFTGNQQILLYQEIQIQIAFWQVISNSYNFFFESLKIVLRNMVTILMMSAKIATLDLLKIKVFWNKGYDVIIFVHDVINKTLSRESNYIVDVVMW